MALSSISGQKTCYEVPETPEGQFQRTVCIQATPPGIDEGRRSDSELQGLVVPPTDTMHLEQQLSIMRCDAEQRFALSYQMKEQIRAHIGRMERKVATLRDFLLQEQESQQSEPASLELLEQNRQRAAINALLLQKLADSQEMLSNLKHQYS